MQRGPWTKQQQHSDQEHREGDSSSSAAVKSKVNANRKDQEVRDGFSTERNLEYDYLLYERTKFGINSRCDCCTAVSRHLPGARVPPGFLVFPLASGLPWFFVFCLWCCSEPEDSVNLSRIQRSNSLCDLVPLLFSCTLSSSQVSMHHTLSITVCTCTPCQ